MPQINKSFLNMFLIVLAIASIHSNCNAQYFESLDISAPSTEQIPSSETFIKYVFETIYKDDKIKQIGFEPFLWKQRSGEPFVTYPFISGFRYDYSEGDGYRLYADMSDDYNRIRDKIDGEAKKLGLIADNLNTIPLNFSSMNEDYVWKYAYTGTPEGSDAKELYLIVFRYNAGYHEGDTGVGIWDGNIKVLHARTDPASEKFYNAVRFTGDPKIIEQNSINLVEIKTLEAGTVYGLYGSEYLIKDENFYYYDGKTATLISTKEEPDKVLNKKIRSLKKQESQPKSHK